MNVSAKVVSFGDTKSDWVFEILTRSYLSQRTARVELYISLLSPTRQGKSNDIQARRRPGRGGM